MTRTRSPVLAQRVVIVAPIPAVGSQARVWGQRQARATKDTKVCDIASSVALPELAAAGAAVCCTAAEAPLKQPLQDRESYRIRQKPAEKVTMSLQTPDPYCSLSLATAASPCTQSEGRNHTPPPPPKQEL